MNAVLTAFPSGRGKAAVVPRLAVLLAVGVGAAFGLTALLWTVGHGRAPHEALGILAGVVLVGAFLLRWDLSADLIVPQIVARRGPFVSAIAFGAVLGTGLASQRRGFWAALLVAALGASSITAAAAGTGIYALVRCAAPLVSIGCTSQACLLDRLKAVRVLLSSAAAGAVLYATALAALAAFTWR